MLRYDPPVDGTFVRQAAKADGRSGRRKSFGNRRPSVDPIGAKCRSHLENTWVHPGRDPVAFSQKPLKYQAPDHTHPPRTPSFPDRKDRTSRVFGLVNRPCSGDTEGRAAQSARRNA